MKGLSRSYSRALFGALGGFLAWLVIEPFTTDVGSYEELFGPVADRSPWARLSWIVGGILIAIPLFSLEDLVWGNVKQGLRKGVVGLVTGAIGIGIATFSGGIVFGAFGSIVLAQQEFRRFLALVLGRVLAWTILGGLLGAALGLALGLARGSLRGALAGSIGGLMGGAGAGLLFDTVAPILGVAATMGLTEPGWGSRLIGLTILGGLIGLFSALSETALAPAVLKVTSSGRMEGREFVVDKPEIAIGRGELCDVPLYYDRKLAVREAVLRWKDGAYWLIPQTPSPVLVNGQAVSHAVLTDGDVITVGETRLIYRSLKGSVGDGRTRCHQCGADNRPTARFCRNCGTALVRKVG